MSQERHCFLSEMEMKETEQIEPKVYLAPMAGITDAAMREVCLLHGADMTYTEMVSAKALSYHNKKTNELLELSEKEQKVIVQIFGNEPHTMAKSAVMTEQLLQDRLYAIDINMGCPAPKIVNNGEGSALMKKLPLAYDIICTVKKAVRVPLGVKFRAGFQNDQKNAVEFAKMAQEAGADMLAVHGRTREQYYSGKADWDIIAQVKQNTHVKVIGNGDIMKAEDAKNMLEQTGCDAVMVARGARGNPFLFTQIKELLEYGAVKTIPSPKEKIETCLHQAQLAVANKGEKLAIMQMRTHAAHYISGMKHAAKLRDMVVRVETYQELSKLLYDYLEKLVAI